MPTKELSCDSPFCTLGPCRTAGKLMVAAACEVPVGCPNRVERGSLAHRAAEYLTSGQNGLTPTAAAVLASSTRGSHPGSLRELLLVGELTLLQPRVRHAIRGGGAAVEAPPPAAVEPAAPDEVRTWIKFKVVEDATGRPIPGVVLRIRVPNVDERDYTTRADGLVEIDEIDPGMCAVSCYRERARLKGTYKFVAMGDQGVSPLPDPGNAERPADEDAGQESPTTEQIPDETEPIAEREPEFASDGRILVVEEHKVQTGESLESIAEANGMTWQELAQFNWDTSVPRQINEHLRDEVGCTTKTRDGNNYIFTSEDDPGVLRIPKAWAQEGLATEQTHTIRVQQQIDFLIILQNEYGLRLPGVNYEVTLANGSKQNGRLNRNGVALLRNPPPGRVAVQYRDPDEIEAISLAQCARKAFDERTTDDIFRLLKHSPEIIKRAIEIYDNDPDLNNLHGGGLVEDIYREITDERANHIVVGLLARSGLKTHGKVRYVRADEFVMFVGREGSLEGMYSVSAEPLMPTVKPGTDVTYTCKSAPGDDPPQRVRGEWYGLSSRDSVARYAAPHVIVGDVGYEWKTAWTWPGLYTVVLRVERKGTVYYFEYRQNVDLVVTLPAPTEEELRESKLLDPEKELAYVTTLLGAWEADLESDRIRHIYTDRGIQEEGHADGPSASDMGEGSLQPKPVPVPSPPPPLPGPSPEAMEAFNKKHAELHAYRQALEKRIAPTRGKEHIRIYAAHRAVRGPKPGKGLLRMFLADMSEKDRDSEPAPEPPSEGPVTTPTPQPPDLKEWWLVDWTDASNLHWPGWYKGVGSTHEEAIANLLDDLRAGNRYPPGWLWVDLPEFVAGERIEKVFQTKGHSDLDEKVDALELITLGAMIVAGAITLVAPVPGSRVVSGAIWISIFSSSTAASFRIAQRLDRGTSNWGEDSLDVLTIVANVFTAGSMAIRATGAARLAATEFNPARTVLGPKGATKFFLVGELATDSVQGVLIGVDFLEKYDAIMGDPTLTPDRKTEELAKLLLKAHAKLALLAVSFHATKRDLAHVRAGHVKPSKQKRWWGLDRKPIELNAHIDEVQEQLAHTRNRRHVTTKYDEQHTTTTRPRGHAEAPRRVRRRFKDVTGQPPPGVRRRDHYHFQKCAMGSGVFIYVRHGNELSLPYIARPGYEGKPAELKAYTAGEGHMHSGKAVADPNDSRLQWYLKNEGLTYAQYTKKLKESGYTVGSKRDGYLIADKDGTQFYSDYDMHGVFDAETGNPISVDKPRPGHRNSLLEEMNVRLDHKALRHGAHDEWTLRQNMKEAGLNYGPQPPVTVYGPDGKAHQLDTWEEMAEFANAQPTRLKLEEQYKEIDWAVWRERQAAKKRDLAGAPETITRLRFPGLLRSDDEDNEND